MVESKFNFNIKRWLLLSKKIIIKN
jgi:hypothetical protein